MALIYESNHFLIESADPPLVDRNDGGHILINPKVRVSDIQKLKPYMAIELMRLLIVTGEAMTTVLNNNGLDIGRINYQDNGNWGVLKPEGAYQHFHLYGRAKSATQQKFGQACFFPHKDESPEFYKDLQPLNSKDVIDLENEIRRLLSLNEFSDNEWKL